MNKTRIIHGVEWEKVEGTGVRNPVSLTDRFKRSGTTRTCPWFFFYTVRGHVTTTSKENLFLSNRIKKDETQGKKGVTLNL